MISLETAQKLKDAGFVIEPQIGDIVSVLWDKNSNTGGLQKAVFQDRPAYGIGREFGQWQAYNGKLNGNPVVEILDSFPEFKGVVVHPSLSQLLADIEARGYVWALRHSGSYEISICPWGDISKTKTFKAKSPDEAAAQALLWIIEQEKGE